MSKGARSVHLILTIMKWIRTSGLSTKNSLSADVQRDVCVDETDASSAIRAGAAPLMLSGRGFRFSVEWLRRGGVQRTNTSHSAVSLAPWILQTRLAAAKQIRHIQESQGQILDLSFRSKSCKYLRLFPFRSEAARHDALDVTAYMRMQGWDTIPLLNDSNVQGVEKK